MVTEMITLKLDNRFLKDIDIVVKKEGYQSRTEFIRNALREKLDDAKLKKALRDIARLRGAAKKKTTDKEYERIREKALLELAREKGWEI